MTNPVSFLESTQPKARGQNGSLLSARRHQRRHLSDESENDEILDDSDAIPTTTDSEDAIESPNSRSQHYKATERRSLEVSSTDLAPKVRSLSVNLNKLVDQRHLISLLTGLDELEELQLNFIQLNLANFEPPHSLDPLDSTGSDSSPQLVNRQATSSFSSSQSSSSTSTPSTTAAVSTLDHTQSSSQREAQQAPSQPTSPSTSTSLSTSTSISTSSSFTTAPATGQSSPVAPSQFLGATQASQTASMSSSGTLKPPAASVQTVGSAPLTPTTAPSTKPLKLKPPVLKANPTIATSQQQSTSTMTQIQTVSASSSKPPISLGAPRGLMTFKTTSSPATSQWVQVNTNGQMTGTNSENQRQARPNGQPGSVIQPTIQPRGLISIGTSQSISYSGSVSGTNLPSTTLSQPTIASTSSSHRSGQTQPVTMISVSSPPSVTNTISFHSRGPQNIVAGSRISSQQDSTVPVSVTSRSSFGFSDTLEDSLTPSLARSSQTSSSAPTSSFGIRTSASSPSGSRQTQTSGLTIEVADAISTSPEFVPAGIRLKPRQRDQSQQAISGSNSASASAVTSSDISNGESSEPNETELKRVKRQSRGQLEEFELSFGELLPNLRHLKLESFIDLSRFAQTASSSNVKPSNLNHGRLRQKRRIMAKDAEEMLLAEESSDSSWAERVASTPSPSIQPEPRSLDTGEGLNGTEPGTEPSSVDPSLVAPSTKDQLTEWKRAARASTLVLTKLFSKLTKLKILQLTSNDIPYWPDQVLSDSRSTLSRLYLISNNIRQMARYSLANLTELDTLDLSSNQLRQLNGDIFKDLVNLRSIRACRNLLRKLPARLLAFRGELKSESRGLEKVDFSKNRYLSQLSPDIFGVNTPRTSVTSLNLSDCAFTDQLAGKQPEILFASVPSLVNLSLQGNKLRHLLTIDGLFAKNNKIQRIDLSRNYIGSLSERLFNGNASQINELSLHHNLIEQIPEQFLFNLKKLRKISLSNNRLTRLEGKIFLTNLQIESIDLSHNQLVSLSTQQSGQIPFGNGANLRHINLSFNNLTQFDSDLVDVAWSFYTNLHTLDLSHNQFSGQISMPIFFTTSDEMHLNLGSNLIQSINIDSLMQHEQILDRFATLDASADANDRAKAARRHSDSTDEAPSIVDQLGKVPTVVIQLSGNPIACDCLLEPLISYSRRVAAATNPTLVASMFSHQKSLNEHKLADPNPPASSRYSVLSADSDHQNGQVGHQAIPKHPQVFYRFKLNDLHCAQPENLSRKPLTHISIGDLLCPIRETSLCPSKCQCHYQSAFKTAIIDCSNRRLIEIPIQLTNSVNFVKFNVETSFSSDRMGLNNSRQINKLDKIIIRLDNNRLSSMSELSRLFTVESSDVGGERNRFARAPNLTSGGTTDMRASEPLGIDREEVEALDYIETRQQQARVQTNNQQKRIMSPVMAGRNNAASRITSRQKRQSTATDNDEEFEPTETDRSSGPSNRILGSDPNSADSSPPSTAVLERAEDFRGDRRYALACEIYLDHNSIDSIPDSFLSALDSVQTSAMQSAQMAPQAALPTLMLDPPIHAKINHPSAMSNDLGSSDMLTDRLGGAATSSKFSSREVNGDETKLFGRHALAPERKLALMETVNENVRLSKIQMEQQRAANLSSSKTIISPTLVVLSLRYNSLSNVNWRLLNRLSKLIKSSNTKLYLGHNPYDCNENFLAANESSNAPQVNSDKSNHGAQVGSWKQSESAMIESVMGDHLIAASDETSGAYLDMSGPESGSDLLVSASSQQDSSTGFVHQLGPIDCPIGQLKNWLTRHHSSIGDLDEMYCVHMPEKLSEKIRLASSNQSSGFHAQMRPLTARSIEESRFEHDHHWVSSMSANSASNLSPNGATVEGGNSLGNGSIVEKNGIRWNSEHLVASAKLIDIDLYDLCPYSGIQVLDPSANSLLSPANQQALISFAAVLVLLSLCLLLMLVYFGDTQTILAFIYIYLNPVYTCLRLNESHLDGDKLYDAFVSYSSADRDIVMELIEKLELQNSSLNLHDGLGSASNLTFDDADSNSKASNAGDTHQISGRLNTLSRRPNGTLTQDLSTLSRHSSRLSVMGGGSSAIPGSQSKLQIGDQNGSCRSHPAYRLCIHERDWLPGHLISWNIVNSVQNSRRTILILSKDFIKSVWFQVEFHTAYYQMLEDKIDRLIVIVRGELPPKNELDKNLAFLLTTKTYLVWGEKWFWERLQYALPHKSQPPRPKRLRPVSKDQLNGSKKLRQANVKANNNYGSTKRQQQPIGLSDIGKDCANLLLPPSQHSDSNHPHSASSSGSSSANSSTGHLLSSPNQQQTTSNDLLSTPSQSNNTTRLTIGGLSGLDTQSGPIGTPAGSLASGGVTSILVGGLGSVPGANSKLRSKKQEKLQSFVEKSISNNLNLSEL